MKYMGSKSRIAKYIVPIIQREIDVNGIITYVEPFVGGANVIDKIRCKNKYGYDKNKYLIALLNHVQSGRELPKNISKEEYRAVVENPYAFENWYVGCVGFLASFNGKFLCGGYANPGMVHGVRRNYYEEASRNLVTQMENLKDVRFYTCDYKELTCRNCLIYCDPPYAGTTKYKISDVWETFDHEEFWKTMRKWSTDNIVLISEETAPDDFECIWEKSVSRSLDPANKFHRIEKLFKYKNGKQGNTKFFVFGKRST